MTEMISKTDADRIKSDCGIAVDALQGLIYSREIHPEYLREKVETVQRCLDFMKHFYEGK